MKTKNLHLGSNFRDFLKNEGILDECEAAAAKQVIAAQIMAAMKIENISKSEMARKMHTCRTSVDRMLNPANSSITLQTLERAAHAVNCQLKFELVPNSPQL
ncbi:MAG: helix-turn-helix domain-containing protein [Victivallaceae bacterium]